MPSNLDKTIVDAFNADSDLATSCPGGCNAGHSDPGSSQPYCELVHVSGLKSGTTGDTYVSRHVYNFNVYGSGRHGVYQACVDIMEVFDKDQDDTALSDGDAREFHRDSDPVIIQLEDDPRVFLGVVTYEVIVQRTLQSDA